MLARSESPAHTQATRVAGYPCGVVAVIEVAPAVMSVEVQRRDPDSLDQQERGKGIMVRCDDPLLGFLPVQEERSVPR